MDSLLQSLTHWAHIHPHQACIVEAETQQTMTYHQYLTGVYVMRQLLGDTPRCIALMLPGGIVSAVVWMSALTGGHTLVPLSPDSTEEEKMRVIRLYKPDVWFIEQQAALPGSAYSDEITIISRQQCEILLLHGDATFEQPLDELAGNVCLMTSGTTGEPKSVLLTERQIAWTATRICGSHQLAPVDRGLTMLPFSHVNAPVVSLFASIIAGSTVIIARRFSRQRFWTWVSDYKVTWVSAVPTILAMLLDTDRPAFLPGVLRFVRTASAPLPVAVLGQFETRFGIPVVETYGLSEAASQVAANPVPPGVHKPGSVGLPVGVSLRVCEPRRDGEDELRDVAPGETGEICVRGPGVIQSYQCGQDQASFQQGWFRTGDLGWQDEDGYLFITGRLRDVINRGGENIAPREVEEALLHHPWIADVAVVGRPDRLYGEVVVAYVVSNCPEHTAEFERSLREHAEQRLSRPKVPVDFVLVDSIPRNASGKVTRQVLREREAVHLG
jgi:acyl-CoA synthetase (AMP-forming)/AMP-acid ligase II